MFTPKISIIVPVYNLEIYIEKTVRSLQAQTYNNFEIVIVDDGSTDSSLSIIRKMASEDSRIIFTSQSNGGAAKARNAGLSLSTGEFITFVDGDDMLSPNVIADNIGYFADGSIDWVAFSIRRTNNKGKYIQTKGIYSDFIISNYEKISSKVFVPYYYERKLSGVACGAIYRKKSISELKFIEGHYYEDSIYFIDLLSNTKKAVLSPKGEYLYVDRENSSQKTPLDYKRLKSDYFCMRRRLKKYRALFPQYEGFYSEQENCYYYFLKNEVSKETEGAKFFFEQFKQEMYAPLKRKMSKEIKFLFYRIIGYNRLKKLHILLKK